MSSGLQQALLREPVSAQLERRQAPAQQQAPLPSSSKQSKRQQQPPKREVFSYTQSSLKNRPRLPDMREAQPVGNVARCIALIRRRRTRHGFRCSLVYSDAMLSATA